MKYVSRKQLMFFWYSHYTVLFFLGFVVVLGFGGFFWYQNLYRYQWDDARKAEFLERNFKETTFKEKVFRNTVEHLKERQRIHGKAPTLSRNIFSGKILEK